MKSEERQGFSILQEKNINNGCYVLTGLLRVKRTLPSSLNVLTDELNIFINIISFSFMQKPLGHPSLEPELVQRDEPAPHFITFEPKPPNSPWNSRT